MWGGGSKYQNRENKYGNYHYKMFKCFNRKFKINEASPPVDVKLAFMECTNDCEHMSLLQFHKFLIEFQGEEDCPFEHAEWMMDQVIKRRYHSSSNYHGNGFTINDFFHFLMYDDLNPPIREQVR